MKYPFDCVVVGLGGQQVQPISNLSLTSCYNIPNLQISGNGGVTDYLSAAHFIALGTGFVQICALAEERGVRIISELCSGLGHFMKELGFSKVKDLYRSFEKPVVDFMDLDALKQIAFMSEEKDCVQCGNCVDCPYLAITFNKGKVTVNPKRCIGCSLCTRRCPGKCLDMRARTDDEPQPDI